PDLLHRVADVDLRGLPGHEERVGVVVDEPVGLLADDRAQDDVAGGGHSASPGSDTAGLLSLSSLSSSRRAAGGASRTGSGPAAACSATSDFVISARASRVRTTTSAGSTR